VSNLVKYNLDFQGEVTVDTSTFIVESASIVNITVSQCVVTIPSSLPIGTRKEIRKLGENETVAITITALNETFTRDALSTLTLINTGSFFILEKVANTRWDIVQSGFVEIDKDNFVKNPLTKNSVLNINQSGTLTISWDDTATDILNTGALKVIAPSSGTNRYFDIQLKTLNANEVGQQWSIKTSYKLATAADDLVSFFLFDGTTEVPTTLNSLPYAGGTMQTVSGAVYPTTTLSNVRLRARFKDSTACTLYLADLTVGPFNPYGGAAIGNWMDYTPTFVGIGTPTSISCRYRRVGSSLEVLGRITTGGVTATPMEIRFPLGLTQISYNTLAPIVGQWWQNSSASGVVKRGVLRGVESTNYVLASVDEINAPTSPFIAPNANAIMVGTTVLAFQFSVPITQWTSNINLVQDFQEFASNSNAADADNTDAFVYGSEGNVGIIGVTNLTSLRRKRVRFSKPIQPTDILRIELRDPSTGMWTSEFVTSDGYPILVGFLFNPSSGMSLRQVNSTDVDVWFWPRPYGDVAVGWGEANFIGVRWRVRKISNGNMAEAPTLPTQLPSMSGRMGSGVLSAVSKIAWLNIFSNDTTNKITYDSTNRRFYFSEAGRYFISYSGFVNSTGAPHRVLLGKNTDVPTASTCFGMTYSNITGFNTIGFAVTIDLNIGDYITFLLSEGSLWSQPNDLFNYFTITKLAGVAGIMGPPGSTTAAGSNGDFNIPGKLTLNGCIIEYNAVTKALDFKAV